MSRPLGVRLAQTVAAVTALDATLGSTTNIAAIAASSLALGRFVRNVGYVVQGLVVSDATVYTLLITFACNY